MFFSNISRFMRLREFGCVSRATLICAWAEKGADAIGPDGVVIHSDAFPPEKLVDTLGAGDTFNASVLYSLSNGMNASLILKHKHLMSFCKLCKSVQAGFVLFSAGGSLQDALTFGCQIAGKKCGVHGYDGILH